MQRFNSPKSRNESNQRFLQITPCIHIGLVVVIATLCILTLACARSESPVAEIETPDKPTAAAYLGRWRLTAQCWSGSTADCVYDVAQVGANVIVKNVVDTCAQTCTGREGIFILTPEGNLRDAGGTGIVLSSDTSTGKLAFARGGSLEYLERDTFFSATVPATCPDRNCVFAIALPGHYTNVSTGDSRQGEELLIMGYQAPGREGYRCLLFRQKGTSYQLARDIAGEQPCQELDIRSLAASAPSSS